MQFGWISIIVMGAALAAATAIASYLFFILYSLAVFEAVSEKIPFFVTIQDDRFFLDPYTSWETGDFDVSIINRSQKAFNGTLFQKVTAFPSSKVVTQFTSGIHMLPGKTVRHGFGTGPLEPGQYIAEAYVNVIERQDILPNGTTYTELIQSSIAQTSFQVFTEQDLINRIIAYGTIAGSAATTGAVVTQILIAKRRMAHEKQIRWKDWYKIHSEQMGQELSENWKSSGPLFASHKIENDKIVSLDPKEPTSKYSQEAKNHLMDGYSSLWKSYESAKSDSIEIKKKMDEIVEQLQDKAVQAVTSVIPDLPKETRWKDAERRFYDIESMASAIITTIRVSKVNQRPPARSSTGKRNIGEGELVTELYLSGTHIAVGTEEEMEKLRPIIDDLLLDREVNRLATEYFGEEKKLGENKNIVRYQHELDGILNKIDAGLPIEKKRSCHICDEMYREIFFISD